MPNGISCACFAIRNHKVGQETNNLFRKGLAGVQTVRTVDAAAQTSAFQKTALAPVSPALNKIAGVLRKLVYPLIIGSAVYNTAKSEDKVKTGCSQAAGIGAMYCSEKVAEKALKSLDNKVANLKGNKYFKAIKVGWYILKGLTYLGISLGGYEGGSKIVSNVIDKIREAKGKKVDDKLPKDIDKREIFKEFA